MEITNIKVEDGKIAELNGCLSIDSLTDSLYHSLPNYPGKYDDWKVVKQNHLTSEVYNYPSSYSSFREQFGDVTATKTNIRHVVEAANELLMAMKREMKLRQPDLVENGVYYVVSVKGTFVLTPN